MKRGQRPWLVLVPAIALALAGCGIDNQSSYPSRTSYPAPTTPDFTSISSSSNGTSAPTTSAASGIPDGDIGDAVPAEEFVAVCSDRSDNRVDDALCASAPADHNESWHIGELFLWSYLIADHEIPAVGRRIAGGTYLTPRYHGGRATRITRGGISTLGRSITRGGFGITGHDISGGRSSGS